MGLLASGRHSKGQVLPRRMDLVNLSSNHASDLMDRRSSRTQHLIHSQVLQSGRQCRSLEGREVNA